MQLENKENKDIKKKITSSRCVEDTVLRDIHVLSFTHSFMVNTRPLVGCLENSDEKVKQFRVTPRIASSRLAYSSLRQCPK